MDVLRHAEEEPTSFASHRRLRVAVVPLGGVPDKRFRSYLSLLQRSFSVLPMANLSKPGSWRKEDSPFKYFSWFDGSLSLQYLDRAPPLSAAAPEWQDYQAFRRTWAVSRKGVIRGVFGIGEEEGGKRKGWRQQSRISTMSIKECSPAGQCKIYSCVPPNDFLFIPPSLTPSPTLPPPPRSCIDIINSPF